MAFRTQKISQMTPKGANLEATDLIEVSTIESGSYVTRSITGQEIIDAAVGNVDWGDIGGTLSNQTDLQNALDAKQDDITLTTTGSSGASTLVGSTLNVPNYTLSGLGGVPTSRTLTINGVTQDLSANRTFTISTGITIGSTAIASGTVGRILFEGAGNVVQESSSLFWDNAANRFQVGTGVNILATNTFPTNANSPYVVLGPYNANFGGDQGALFNLTNNNTTGNSAAIFRFGMTSPATGAIGEFGATSSTFSGFTSLVFFNSKGAFPLAFLTNDTERLRIHGTTGNVLINTTTDAGFRLDVNGTARVQGASYFGTTSGNVGIGTTDASTPFGTAKGLVINAGSGNDAQVRLQNNAVGATASDGGLLSISNTLMYLWNYEAGPLIFGTGNAERMRIFSTGNIGINTTTDAGFRLDVNGTARFVNDVNFNASARFGDGTARITGAQIGGQGANNGVNTLINNGADWIDDTNVSALAIRYNQGIRIPNTTRYPLTIGSNAKAVASAQIEMVSTTQGFLPPRMTTTQKNAIASPAAGLMVYDTTLNVISYYNGTMWI